MEHLTTKSYYDEKIMAEAIKYPTIDNTFQPFMYREWSSDKVVKRAKDKAEKAVFDLECVPSNSKEGFANKMRIRSEEAKIAAEMSRLNMKMGVFVAHTVYWREPNLTSGNKDMRAEFLKEIEESVEVAKRVNATWMTVVPGHRDLRLKLEYQTANVVESLKQASDILEPHNLVMVLEPLNFYNHPGLFLERIPQAFEVCRAVGSPSCKILDDLYHQQITEGNLIPNIDHAWDEIAYFQIGDNPGRNEPTTGEINYLNVFKHIDNKGFKGILGMEHGNSIPGKEGEQALINAYKAVDKFK